MRRAVSGSTLAVASSRHTTLGCSRSTRARHRICCCPTNQEQTLYYNPFGVLHACFEHLSVSQRKSCVPNALTNTLHQQRTTHSCKSHNVTLQACIRGHTEQLGQAELALQHRAIGAGRTCTAAVSSTPHMSIHLTTSARNGNMHLRCSSHSACAYNTS